MLASATVTKLPISASGISFSTLCDGADDVGELADAARLDEDAVRVILVDDLTERLAEVAHQRAADAAGVHLRHLNAGFLHEAAVDADFAELVFNEDELSRRKAPL